MAGSVKRKLKKAKYKYGEKISYEEARKAAVTETTAMSRKEIRKAIRDARSGRTDTRRRATKSKIPGIFSSSKKKRGYIMRQKIRSIDPLKTEREAVKDARRKDVSEDVKDIGKTLKHGGKTEYAHLHDLSQKEYDKAVGGGASAKYKHGGKSSGRLPQYD